MVYSKHNQTIFGYALCIGSLIATQQQSMAQYNSIFYDTENLEQGVRVYGEYEISSNGFRNEFTNKFSNGSFIDDGIKNRALKGMNSMNNFAVSLNYGVNVLYGRRSERKFLIGYKEQTSFVANYTKDFFELVFYGNKPFIGQTANLGGTKLKLQNFRELNFGMLFENNDTSARFGISISAVGGKQFADVSFNSGTYLYTSASGDLLNIQTNIDAAYSGNRKRRFDDYPGMGASSNIFFEAPYRGRMGRKNLISIHVNDLGFIYWSENTRHVTSDTNFTFEGIQITNIRDLTDSNSVLNTFNGVLDTVQQSHNSLLNSSLLIVNKTYLHSYVSSLSFGFRYIFNHIYKPYFFSEQEINISNKLGVILHESYGGYSRGNVGVTFVGNFRKWMLKLGTNQVQGYILPRMTYGQSAFFSLTRRF